MKQINGDPSTKARGGGELRIGLGPVFASFIRKPADIASVHEALGPGDKIMVIAKIENQVRTSGRRKGDRVPR